MGEKCSTDVANVIYMAATDSTQRLRYIAGPDAEKLIGIRNSKNEQEYIETIRSIFAADGFKE